MRLIRLLLIFQIGLAASFLSANEHGDEKPAEGHGEKGAAPAVEKNFSGRQTEEWLIIQNQLTTLKGKVETQKTLLDGLILQKVHGGGHFTTEDDRNLKKEHATWMSMVEEYNTLNTSFQNRFPEKGAALGRIYKRIDPENIEKIETQLTAEGRMRRLNKKIQTQYNQPETSVEKSAPHEASEKKVHTVESSSKKKKITDEIPVTDQIILQK